MKTLEQIDDIIFSHNRSLNYMRSAYIMHRDTNILLGIVRHEGPVSVRVVRENIVGEKRIGILVKKGNKIINDCRAEKDICIQNSYSLSAMETLYRRMEHASTEVNSLLGESTVNLHKFTSRKRDK